MLKSLLHKQLAGFEKTWGYDAGYMHELLDVAGPWALIRFGMVSSLGHGTGAPAGAMAAAGILGTLSEDCGPCTQLGVDMAAGDGVKSEIIRAILAGDRAAMGPDARLGYDFARAVLTRDLEGADAARDEVIRRWGQKAVMSLSLAVTTARMYPTLKYGMGHGRACSKLVVAGVSAPFTLSEPVAV